MSDIKKALGQLNNSYTIGATIIFAYLAVFSWVKKYAANNSDAIQKLLISAGKEGSAAQNISDPALHIFLIPAFAAIVLTTILVISHRNSPGKKELTKRIDTLQDENSLLEGELEAVKNDFSIAEAPPEKPAPNKSYKDIQREFVRKIASEPEPKNKKVTATGFTYKWFWPRTLRDIVLNPNPIIDGQKSECICRDWDFTFYYTSPRFLETCVGNYAVLDFWRKDAWQIEGEIKNWLANPDNLRFLSDNKVTLRFLPHRTIPFVHGKYWADGARFFHLAWWGDDKNSVDWLTQDRAPAEASTGLRYPGHPAFHEIIEPNNPTERAIWYRRLLDNWLRKYEADVEAPLFDSNLHFLGADQVSNTEQEAPQDPIGVLEYKERGVDAFKYLAEGDFTKIHKPLLTFLNKNFDHKLQKSAIDIGCGLGRDAKALADRGWHVLAVDPWEETLDRAKQINDHKSIRWLRSYLPALDLPVETEKRFDLVLLSASWMHVPPSERVSAIRRIVDILEPGGILAISLRNPVDKTRNQFPATSVELRLLASDHNLFCEADIRLDDTFPTRSGTVVWDYLVFRKDTCEDDAMVRDVGGSTL